MSEKDKSAIMEIEMTYYKLIVKNWADYYLKAEIIAEDKVKDLVMEYEKLFDRHRLITPNFDDPDYDRGSILEKTNVIITNEIEKYSSIFYVRSMLKDTLNIVDEEESDEFYLACEFQSECLKAIVKSLKEYLASNDYKIYVPDAIDPSKCGAIQLGKAIHGWLKNNP